MTTWTTWTAPQSGWYQLGEGEPRLLDDAEVEALTLPDSFSDPGTATVITWSNSASAVGWIPADAKLIVGER